MQLFSRTSVCKQLVAAICTMTVGANLMATPQPPPFLCIDDAGCVETSDRYGLQDAIVGVPFRIDLPVPPTITSEATVTPATIDANKVNGRRLILAPGNYGNQAFGNQDLEIVITTGVNIGNITIGGSARRLLFRAEPIRSGNIGYFHIAVWDAPEDIVFDGVYQHQTGFVGDRDSNLLHGTRIGVINSHIYALAQAVASFPSQSSSVLRHCIIGNNILWAHGEAGGQSVTRFHVPQELVYVDNRVVKTGSDHHNFRIHGASGASMPWANNVYAARNQFEKSPHMIRGSDGQSWAVGLNNIWYENNDWYFSLGWRQPMQMDAGDAPNFLSLRNNRLYSASGDWPPMHRQNWVYENNQTLPYVAPPPWEFR